MKKLPSVFIGSSKEGLAVAETIQVLLEPVTEVTTWAQGIFELTKTSIESLNDSLDDFDFAILVLTPDDLTRSRKKESLSPRDNVLFELGLFMGRLGRNRCFLVYDPSKNIKLPTDLMGVTAATYRTPVSGNLEAALGAACTRIKKSITSLGSCPRLLSVPIPTTKLSSDGPNLTGTWQGFSPEGPAPKTPNSTMEIEQEGIFIRATVRRQVREGVRIFVYEGKLSSGQLILFFEDRQGPGFIVGTMVLYLSGDLNKLEGRTTYYHHTQKKVVSNARKYIRVK